jgi:cytochrome c oxidase subunit 2
MHLRSALVCAPVRRGAVLRVLGISLLVAAIVAAIAIFVPWLPDQDSLEAERIDFVFWFVTAICVGVFAVVAGVSIYAGLKFRVRPDDDTDGPPVHGHTGLEIAWTAVPFALVTAIGIVSAVALAKNDEPPKNHLEVNVLAQQFTWSFTYPQYGDIPSTTLRLPVNRTVRLTMTSRDVLHSFFVPEFRQKQDLVPGETHHLNITPKHTGNYVIQCAELCGLGHALMLQRVQVMSQAAFTAWVKQNQKGVGAGGENAGKVLFHSNGCDGCHTYKPAGATAKVGPDLDKLPDYAKQANKPLEEFVRESIVDPSAYVQPKYPNVMPPFKQLPAKDIDALVQFLSAQGGSGGSTS